MIFITRIEDFASDEYVSLVPDRSDLKILNYYFHQRRIVGNETEMTRCRLRFPYVCMSCLL